jgi:hypothetical protein
MVSVRKTRACGAVICCALVLCLAAKPANAQGPSPETASTLFPGGAYVAYESIFLTRKAPAAATPAASLRATFEHDARLFFTWGFRRDFELAAVLPIATRSFHFAGVPSSQAAGGTGLGDAAVTVKYRFLRLDSDRGTTQLAGSFGVKLPTGRTGLRDLAGLKLPAGLQPGTGSTDLLFGLNATYTGLFNIHKLVADGAFLYTLRTEGSLQTELGDTSEARLWLSYRPYQAGSVGKEWWIGPALTWVRSLHDMQNGVTIPNSEGDILRLGAVTYFSPRAGIHLWFSADFPVAQTRNGVFCEERRRFTFGVTRQFRLRR